MSNACHNWENSHTWEYWGRTAGHGAFFGLQALEQGAIFEVPDLAKGDFLSFQINLALALSYFFADFSSHFSRIPSVFFSLTIDILEKNIKGLEDIINIWNKLVAIN